MSTSTPSKSSTSSKYHSGDVPERVLAAAREMLAETPAREISVRELARRSSVSHGAPYRHFVDRAGFLTALAAACFAEFIENQQAAFDHAAPSQRLLAVGTAYVDFAVAHPHAFALIFDPSINPSIDPPAELRPLIDRHAELLGASLEDAIQSGRLAVDHTTPADLGAALWSAAHGLAHLTATGRIAPDRPRAILDALLQQRT